MLFKREDFFPGHYYHLFNRAVAGQKLFRDSIDYENGIKLLTRFYHEDTVGIIAYCLMPDHYHFLLYQKTEYPVYSFLCKWSNAYTKYFNIRHRTAGTIFSDEMQSVPVMDDKAICDLCALIHLNPLKENLVSNLSEWQWSDYHEWTQNRGFKTFNSSESFVYPKADYLDSFDNLKAAKEALSCLIDNRATGRKRT